MSENNINKSIASNDSNLLSTSSSKRTQDKMSDDETTKSNKISKSGWLLKWTNYLKGYQKRWFVLSNGVLSYYRNQTEVAHTCRGTISLHGALIHTVDSCTFVISNGGTQTFHIKASNEVERQSWVTALELAKAKAIRAIESEEEEEDNTANVIPSEELNTVVRDLTIKLENLKTCYDLITKHGSALQRALAELESGEDLASKNKIVNERATLFRISSNAMINACTDYLTTAQTQGHKWSKMIQHVNDQKLHLEEMVEQLARQHSHLEQAAAHQGQRAHGAHGGASVTSPSDDEENEFYDAQEGASIASNEDTSFILKIPGPKSSQHQREMSNDEDDRSSSEGEEYNSQKVLVVAESTDQNVLNSADTTDRASIHSSNSLTPLNQKTSLVKRRTKVPDKPNHPLNLWSIIKNCIGKDLSKIPMPVNFNEPLSLLQRLTEDFEYAELLDKAAQAKTTCEQLAYVAAFTISSYSTTANRTGKPFNPLLGETYECDRTDDLGWKCISEQVSHHPPMAAQYCEGRGWRSWQEFTMTSKFRGKYIQVVPLGNAHVEFTANGNKFSWRKVTTTVHNIIVGRLWVDNHGDMEIIGENNATGYKCHLKYLPYSYFTRDSQRRVKGVVMDPEKQVKWVLNGTWDNKMELASVTSTSGSPENPVYRTSNYKTIWQRRLPPADCDKYYNFTTLACQLNEPEEGVAPTDSRLRPDQRLMENAQWDESNSEKLRLEEQQRQRRRQREAEAERATIEGRPYPPYEPIWFKKEKEEGTDNVIHVYRGQYWECKSKQDWSRCPSIF
ncbi:hypothetical protein PVAND_008867 [Polypedilum vanderplanki]|uniref:Oxysterol-binding protein n=1 Tax=Polypedilum vanderplanki TaxID=319348 RepID=A0A9J6CBP6_POLVA|nr:hypothetical protein PVAND_008867 [Polypedilum vanderplanki]